jgi:predicted small integral membrane protein
VQNIVNLQAGHGFVAYVASMADHTAYPAHFGPPVTVPAITWLMYFTIVALELAAGLFAAKGAYDMFMARSAFAGAYFQAWQTEAGGNAVREAALFSIQHGIILLVLATRDD